MNTATTDLDIFALSDTAVDELMALDAVDATFMGVTGHDDRWTDLSPDGVAARRAYFVDLRSSATACPADDRRADVAKRVLLDECDLAIARIDDGTWKSDLNNIVSPWQDLRVVFDLAPKATIGDWEAIATRLETIDQALDGYRASLELGMDEGRVPAKRQVRVAIEQGRQAAGDGSSFDQLAVDLDAGGLGDGALRQRLVDAVRHAKASYGAMTEWFEATYLPAAREADGVGSDAYVRAAAQYLGTTIDPHATSTWGWSEVERIRNELVEVCRAIDPDRSVHETLHLLETDPDRSAPDVETFITEMQARQDLALEKLAGTHFEVDPRIHEVEVKVAPPGGSTAPYYTGPSEDFSRPGRVWYPVDGRTSFPLFSEITTAYHEGFPGHHLQVGWQATMGDELSRFHRTLVWYPGSGEGWALYAEQLMQELGYFEKPDYVAGMLVSQLFRACRIVIDIGLHLEMTIPDSSFFHPGETWSYDLATEMMRDVAHQPPAVAESEVTRYLGWPGQAISYKLGERAILDLRAEMEQQPGFDRKDFHAALLSVGSVGLDLMADLVRDA